MNNMNSIAAAVALLGCAVSGNVLAQSDDNARAADAYNPSWYIAPSINGIDPDNRFGTDRRGMGVGLRFGKPVAPSWDIQFGGTASRARDGATQYRQNTLGVDALYMFSRRDFRPFVLIGTGAEYDKVNRFDSRASRTGPYVTAGIGFQYGFSEQWGMQADVRRAYSYLGGHDFDFNHAHINTLTVGLLYVFDKPPAPALVARVEAPPPRVVAAPAPAARPVPAPAPAPAPAARYERYTLSSTELFEFDRSEVRQPQPKLDEIAEALSHNTQSVTITGYTDRLGGKKYNQKLSLRRAEAVKVYLTNKGIDANRLTAEGRGENDPVVQCTNRKRAALIQCLEPNRRVEIDKVEAERRVK